MKTFSYFLRTESGDDYHAVSEKDYDNAVEFMKDYATGEYEAWKAEGLEDDEIPYEKFSKIVHEK